MVITQSLSGTWELQQIGRDDSYPALVPGCVHLDLMAANVIEDPYYRDNELDVLWIGESDWVYRRTFTVDSALLDHDKVMLRCDGLDTLASISINGQVVGTTDNMFRVWRFDAKSYLKTGQNEIAIAFRSALRYVQHQEETVAPMYAYGVGVYKLNGGGWIRKQTSNFGWDWGPKLLTCGIWRDIALIGVDHAEINNVNILQSHAGGGVRLSVQVDVSRVSEAEVSVEVQVLYQQQIVAQQRMNVQAQISEIDLAVLDPHLWWPHGMGDQPLYDVVVKLSTSDGTVIDTTTKRIGLRTLRLVRQDDQWGESFQFVVNDVPFFAKGANWIPADTFVTRLTDGDYRRLLQAAVDVHMNMIRVWGGGIYEPDIFYDLCDELGLCVWQDFMFACTTYPTFDQAFMASAEAEAEDAVRRLRHHASLALWCGNNEIEQGLVSDTGAGRMINWAAYAPLFDELLQNVVAQLAPQTDYWPGSPHTPRGDRNDWNNPKSGDAHLWAVWHERKPFETYRACDHRFVSEFGFQSFPEPRTVETYTLPQDRNITSYIMEHHQRSLIGNSTIVHYMTDWFRLPTSFDMMLWLSQILQGMAIKYAIEHWRRNVPRTMGAIYWQINDCWPVASWSSIDYFGRWKALHYMTARFFAPYLVSAVEDIERGTAKIYVSSDAMADTSGQIEWLLTDLDGASMASGATDLTIPARSSQLLQTLELAPFLETLGNRSVLLWLYLSVDGNIVSSNLASFARFKHLDLCDPELKSEVWQDGDKFKVRLTAERPALYTWLSLSESDAHFSDNFFHMLPDKPVEITLSTPHQSMTLEAVQQQLKVHSLTDTYR